MKTRSKPALQFRVLSNFTLAALAAFGAGKIYAETDISNAPFVGASQSYPPNVLLALSVEFPTAGAAYNAAGLWGNTAMMQQTKDDPFPFYLYRQFTSGTAGRVPRLTKAAFEAGSFVGYFDQKNTIPITRQTVISRLWPMRMQKATAVAVNTAAKR